LCSSPDGCNSSLSIRQDGVLYAALLAPNEQVEYKRSFCYTLGALKVL
jgi:hypothetical protein